MKKMILRSVFMIIVGTLCIGMAGCGKKKDTVGENISNLDPNEVQGLDKYSDLGSNLDVGEDNQSGEIVNTIYPDDSAISGNSVSDNTVTDINVSSDTVSDNSLVSGNTVSDNSVSDNNVNNTESKGLSDFETSEVYVPKENNELNIVNLSGKNITAVYVTFSEGNLKGSEILGKNKLKDGKTYTYKIDDMDSLKNAGILTLSITAIDKKDKDIDFGSISIVDPNNMTIVLSHGTEGYYLYQN